MKKFIINAGLLLVMIAAMSSCKKNLEDKYNNPEKTTKANVPGLFTAMQNNDRLAAKYWNVRTFLCQMPGVYAQTSYISNANSIYQQSDGYSQQYWEDFYMPSANGGGAMGLYRSMEALYNTLTPTEQASQKIFMMAAKVTLIEQAAKMVDMWGDIPYAEAGSLEATNLIKKPKFDDQKALYNVFISDLAAAATYFATAKATPDFSKYDILLSGNVGKWAKYANSLRLRLLMHTSMVDEANAKTAVLAILSDPATYPLVDGGNVGTYSPASSDILLRPLTDNTATLKDAFTEGSWYATDYMLNTVMKPANDPRIPAIYDKYGRTTGGVFVPNTDYRAMPITFTSAQQDASFQDYSVLDSATFLMNPYLPGIVITASEVNFLKAEAYQRWGSTSDAKIAYENALRQSVTFYYYLNNLNTTGAKTAPVPAAGLVDNFINASTASFTGSPTDKLTSIYTQKWAHFGVLQSIEAWTELRRTGYPVLTFPSAGKLPGFSAPPKRLIYPSSEISYNSTNYMAVAGKDDRMTKLFWQP